MKISWMFSAIATILILTASGFAQADANEKAKTQELFLKATQILEADPFVDKAKDFRGFAMRYVIETDDVSVTVCSGPVLEPIMDKKNKYSSELLAQYTLGMAAFKLQNPAKKDEDEAQLAGLESSIKAYQAILKSKPKSQFPVMDDFVTKLQSGELKKLVLAAKCGSGKTEPIK